MTTQIFLLLDMTSSMSRNKEGAMDACKEFIEGLGENQRRGVESDAVFTLGVFNSNIGLERVAREVPVEKAPKIDHEHYHPAGATPLYDAIGQSMDLLEAHAGPVMLVIQTDGEENSSQSVTRQDIVERIAEKTALGWQFVYLGCDIDAMEHGADIGIPAGNTMSYTRLNAKAAFADLATSTAQYLQDGSTSSAKFFPGAQRHRNRSVSKGNSSRRTS
ncbi:MAG: vWA domain-containing protein [Verrucomicrobiota bacterium]|nr:vWA domain-containing protein [Verrucomicrobiota bacterium]